MGWEDYHLHCFEVGWDRYGNGEGASQAMRAGQRAPDDIIEVEQIYRPAPGVTYPRYTAARRVCPPEDRGGPYGYVDMLKALPARNGARYRESQRVPPPQVRPRSI